MKNFPHGIAIVYIAPVPDLENLHLGEKAQQRSFFGEKLLKQTCLRHFGNDSLHKDSRGKYLCDEGYVSLSHSGKYVAVAICDKPVGIDLQKADGGKFFDVAKKFFTAKELQQFEAAANKEDCFYTTWCKKEALWKSLETQPPTVATVETTGVAFTTQTLHPDATYYLAVTGEAKIKDLPFLGCTPKVGQKIK